MSASVPTSGAGTRDANSPHPMDPEPKDSSWRQRLFHEDQEFPLTYTATQPDQAAAAKAWEGTAHLDEFRALAESVLEHDAPEGSLVLLADPDGVAAARVYAAVCLARLLAERGQRVLIAQTHVAEQAFLLDNEFDEVEGFVDLVLYGVSPSITCRPTRLPRIDVLALGSFRPEPGSVYPEDELRRAFGQLRASYDVVLMMVTARVADGDYNPLLRHADAVVLVTGVQQPEELEALRGHLKESGSPVWGAVVFTSASETVDLTVEGALEEKRRTRPVPTITDAAPPLVIHEASRTPPRRTPPRRHEPRNESSPFFRRFAIAIAVVLLGFGGWWAWMQFFSASGSTRPTRTPVVADASPQAATSGSAVPETNVATPPQDASASTPAVEEDSPSEATQNSGAAAADDAAATPAKDEATTAAATEPVDGPTDTRSALADEPFEAPGSTGGATTSTTPPAKVTPPPVTPDPAATGEERLASLLKRKPGGGFGLYVWSFPHSNEAEGALQSLRKDGYDPVVVPADIPGKGRWYRVVVGNFQNRQDALDAREILTKRSDVDWAGLVHVN